MLFLDAVMKVLMFIELVSVSECRSFFLFFSFLFYFSVIYLTRPSLMSHKKVWEFLVR